MSCLYSSPEVTSVSSKTWVTAVTELSLSRLAVVNAMDGGRHGRHTDPARLTRTESQCRSTPHQFSPYVAVNNDAFPNSPARMQPAASSHSACQNKHSFVT
jgi:hypothetical protein